MPYVTDGPDGPSWTSPRAAPIRPEERRRPGRAASTCPGKHHRVDIMAETGLYEDGEKDIRRVHRSAPAHQGHGARRRRCRGDLRHPGRGHAAQRPRGGQRDVPHLQRLAEGLLQPLSRPAHRPRLPALRRHRRGGAGDPPRAPRWACRGSSCRARGTWSRCGTRCGSRCGRRSTTCSCRCTSTPSRRCRRGVREKAAGPRAPRRDVHRRVGLPDEPDQHPGRDHRRRRARALSATCASSFGESGIGWMPYALDRMDFELEDRFRDLGSSMKPSATTGGASARRPSSSTASAPS